MRLENAPPNVDVIFNYFKKEAKVFVGQVKLRNGGAIVPMSQPDFQVVRGDERSERASE